MSTNKSILRSAGLIGFATLCSRILGFLRDVVIARMFGVYTYAQAFVIAFKIPNLFRDFIGEGASNAAFVPVFSEYAVKHSKEDFWELANVVLNLLLIALMAITLLGILLSGVIVRLIAPGFLADPAKLEATIRLTRILFPYLLLVSLAAYAMGILNSLKHFAIPAFAPCFLNISIIVFTLFYGESLKGLALGVLIGGFLQLAVQIPILYQKGFRLKLFSRFRHPAAGIIGRLMVPRIFSSCIYQLNNFVDSIFGSLAFIVGEGGVAVLYFSYRLILFPLGIFSTALAQAILPTFSRQALESSEDNLKESLSFGLRITFFILLPVSVAFMVLAKPIILTLFAGNKFDAYAVNTTSAALLFYSIGLVFYGATRILQACFFALKDTVTPTKIAFLSLCINITFNSVLMFPLKVGGLALATSISAAITCLLLFFILTRRLKQLAVKAIALSFLRILLASLGMGYVCLRLNNLPLWLMIIAGFLSYLLFSLLFGVKEIRQLWKRK